MSCYYMLIRKFYLEGSVRQCLNDCPLKLYYIILRQNNPSSAIYSVISTYQSLSTRVVIITPSLVSATVFS